MVDFFEKIKWQDGVVDLLKRECGGGKISHAYLFCGPAGSGKLNCAKALACSILRGDFAGMTDDEFSERVATKVNAESYADVHVLRAEGAREYLVDQIRDVVSGAQRRPNLSDHKIYIIADACKLGTASANAFLKTLEEPASFVHIVLLANTVDGVLPTIVSRCQLVNFKSLPSNKAVEYVQKNAGCAPDDARFAVDLFGGDTTRALDFCTNQDMQDLCSEVTHIFGERRNLDS